jgi:hypothetical protein
MTKTKSTYLTLLALLLSPTAANALLIDIQPFQMCNDAGGACAQTGFFEPVTDKIWAQAGIDINFLAMSQINETDWLDVNVGNAAVVAQETIDVMAAGRAINDSDVTLAINLFFVDLLDGSATFFGLGCGANIFSVGCAGEVGIFIAGGVFDTNRIDTIAHEIGHVLELFHTVNDVNFGADPGTLQGGFEDPFNLMTRGCCRTRPGSLADIAPDGLGLSQLVATQIATAQGSRFVQDAVGVPEPSTLLLFGTGLLVFGFRKRKMT